MSIHHNARLLVERINPSPEFAKALRKALADRLETEWITAAEFARQVGIHNNTAANWCKAGRVKHYITPAKRYMVALSEVDRVMSMASAPTGTDS